MGLRSWIRRIERSNRGGIGIPQRDGSIRFFSEREFGEAYILNLEQQFTVPDEKPPAHPVQEAMLNAAVWEPHYDTFTFGLLDENSGPPPDLSE